jgi:hypothetical protein
MVRNVTLMKHIPSCIVSLHIRKAGTVPRIGQGVKVRDLHSRTLAENLADEIAADEAAAACDEIVHVF